MTEHHDGDRNHPPAATPRKVRLTDNVRAVVVTGLVSASLLSLAYGVTLHRADEQAEQHQTEMRHDVGPPAGAQFRPPA